MPMGVRFFIGGRNDNKTTLTQMSRDAKLFTLFNFSNWKVLVSILPDSEKGNIAIFDAAPNHPLNCYAILSCSDTLDIFIRERMEAGFTDRDIIMEGLKNNPYQYQYLYGDKELVNRLTIKLNNDLDLVHWSSFEIQRIDKGGCAFLLCHDKKDNELLLKFLTDNEYDFQTSIQPSTQFWLIKISFKDYPQVLTFNTQRTSLMYSRLLWLNDGTVKYIGTGKAKGRDEKGELIIENYGVIPFKTSQHHS
jgi:hypothetical protein